MPDNIYQDIHFSEINYLTRGNRSVKRTKWW